jgi:hypothetical protein
MRLTDIRRMRASEPEGVMLEASIHRCRLRMRRPDACTFKAF